MENSMAPFVDQKFTVEIKYNFFDLEDIEMTPEEILQDLSESLAVNNLHLIANDAILQNPGFYEKLPECLARSAFIRSSFFSVVATSVSDDVRREKLAPSIERYNRICALLKDGESLSLD